MRQTCTDLRNFQIFDRHLSMRLLSGFAPVQGYQQIRAGEVWALFRKDYPRVEELAPLQPMFETFGLPQGGQIGFGITMGAPRNRFWFISSSGDELIQFQQDRLLHNWRKIGDQNKRIPYVRENHINFRVGNSCSKQLICEFIW